MEGVPLVPRSTLLSICFVQYRSITPTNTINGIVAILPPSFSTMKLLPLLTIAVISSMEDMSVSSFSTTSPITPKSSASTKTQLYSTSSPNLDRRSVLTNLASSVLLGSSVIPAAANAAPIPDLPSVTRFVCFLSLS